MFTDLSSFSTLEPDLQTFGSGIAAFMALLFGVLSFITARRNKLVQAVIYIMAALVWWAGFSFFYGIVKDPILARNLRIFSVIGIVLIAVGIINYAFVGLKQCRPLSLLESYLRLVGMGTSLVPIFFLTHDLIISSHLIVGDLASSTTTTLSPDAGPLFWIIVLYHGIAILLLSIAAAFQFVSEKTKEDKSKTLILAAAIVVSLIFGGTRFLPWYDIMVNPMWGIVAVPLVIAVLIYLIWKYRLFNIELIVTELLVFTLWTFSFFRIILPSAIHGLTTDLFFFAISVILGTLLIKNALDALRSKNQLEAASQELQILNTSLELMVAKRTNELVHSNKHLETLIENIPIGLIETTAGGTVSRINRAVENVLHIERNQITQDMPVSTLPDSLQMVLKNAQTKGESDDLILAGTIEQVIVATATHFPLSDNENGTMYMVRDVTKDRALDRSKSEFISTAAHQLRTPIAGLRWLFNFLATEDSKSSLTEEQREIISKGEHATENITKLINDLLDVAYMTGNQRKFTFELLDIRPLILNAVDITKPFADMRHVTIAYQESDVALQGSVDVHRIVLAIQNLIDNAIKYSPAGSTVTIRSEKKDAHISIQIHDAGIGIGPEEIKHLFESFFRGKRAVQMQTEGTGLGLVIVKAIIDEHKGMITVESEVNKGTVFTILLPIVMV